MKAQDQLYEQDLALQSLKKLFDLSFYSLNKQTSHYRLSRELPDCH